MLFNAVFNSISVRSRRPVHLSILSWSLEFFSPVLGTIFLPSHWLLSHLTIVETTDSGDTGMNPVAMTIINPRKEYWQSRGSNQRPPVLKSVGWLVVLGFKATLTAKVISWRSVTHTCFLAF